MQFAANRAGNPYEEARLEALGRYEVLDTDPEPAFDRIVRLVAKLFDMPIATITLVDSARQWFKARHGLDVAELRRYDSFCDHAILARDVTVVPDALVDDRFAANPFVVGEPHIRFYAGAPLVTPEGFALGTLCTIDRVPRTLSPDQLTLLAELAAMVVHELEVRAALGSLYSEVASGRRLRRTLEGEQARLAALLDATGSAALTTDGNGMVTGSNDAALRLFGLKPNEAIGLPLARLISADIEAAYDGNVAREAIGTRNDGHVFPLELVGATWTGADGRQARGVVARDITQRRAIEADRKQETLKVLTRLARGVAHDLNNLLQPVIGLTELELECLGTGDSASADATRENLKMVASCGRQIQGAVIGKILTFAWEAALPPVPIELSGLLLPILAGIWRGLPPSIHPVQTLGNLADSQVRLHEADLASTLSSLVENAVIAMDGGGTLSINALPIELDDVSAGAIGCRAGPYCAITVTDSGHGMDRATLACAFDPFFSTRPIGDGDGLGLTAALAISRRWGGSLTAQSEPGRGSAFTLTIPLIPGDTTVQGH